jgi:hypothetical protein
LKANNSNLICFLATAVKMFEVDYGRSQLVTLTISYHYVAASVKTEEEVSYISFKTTPLVLQLPYSLRLRYQNRNL